MPVSHRLYPTMNFPDYVYREYPKMVTLPSGRKVTVADRQAELNAFTDDSAPMPPSQEAIERNKLAAMLAETQARAAMLEAQLAEAKGAAPATATEPPKPDEVKTVEADPLAALLKKK